MKARHDSKVELVGFMGGDDQVAMSAWVSFAGDDAGRLEDQDRVKGLINFLMREKHMTPFESSVFTFAVETPIFVAREFFRHRSASYNEWSGRYSKMLPHFYVPERKRPLVQEGKAGAYQFTDGSDEQYAIQIRGQHRTNTVAWEAYQDSLNAGIAKEVARINLPLSTYTRFYVTMNARNLSHFIGLRSDIQALYEIRDVSDQMAQHFADKMPMTYEAWRKNAQSD